MNEDYIIIFREIIVFYDFLVKFLEKCIILQLTVAQLQQEFLGAARIFRIQRKLQIEQVLSQGPGKGLLEKIKIFEGFFFRKGKKSFLQLRFDVFFPIYVTAADAGYGTPIVCILLPDFKDFFFIHLLSPLPFLQKLLS